jgi:hypothetical protein
VNRYSLIIMVDDEKAWGNLKAIQYPYQRQEYVAPMLGTDGQLRSRADTVGALVRSMCRQISKWEK